MMMMQSWTAAIPVAGAGMARREADRVTAIACAARLAGIAAGGDTGYTSGSHDAERVAEKLAGWLAEDEDDHHAPGRRTVLCLAISLAGAATDTDGLITTAKWMLKFVAG
jgi:hypothetical protein